MAWRFLLFRTSYLGLLLCQKINTLSKNFFIIFPKLTTCQWNTQLKFAYFLYLTDKSGSRSVFNFLHTSIYSAQLFFLYVYEDLVSLVSLVFYALQQLAPLKILGVVETEIFQIVILWPRPNCMLLLSIQNKHRYLRAKLYIVLSYFLTTARSLGIYFFLLIITGAYRLNNTHWKIFCTLSACRLLRKRRVALFRIYTEFVLNRPSFYFCWLYVMFVHRLGRICKSIKHYTLAQIHTNFFRCRKYFIAEYIAMASQDVRITEITRSISVVYI